MVNKIDIADFRGCWALVTGASAGIGQKFATRFAAAGLNVVLIARREARLTDLAADLRTRYGISTVILPVDMALANAAALIKQRLDSENIRIRVLCNNCAFGHWGSFEDASGDSYQRMVQVNASAMVSLCLDFLPQLREYPTSVIINVSSGAAFQPVPYMAVYAATKAFVTSFSLALHGELNGSGVLVQTLIPGPTATEFDTIAGAPAALVGRASAATVVEASMRHLKTGRPLALHAKGTYKQRLFNGLVPVEIVLKTVAKMFRPGLSDPRRK